jgi:hypothetical protein
MKVNTVEYLYPFERPKLMSEEEFHSLKFILRNDPNKDITPSSNFITEFSGFFITVGVFILSMVLVNTLEFMALVGGLSMIAIVAILVTGTAKSMINYGKNISRNREFYNKLKELIISSPDYDNFKNRYSKI